MSSDKPVLDYNEHDAEVEYWSKYNGGTTKRLCKYFHKNQLVANYVKNELNDARVLDLGCGFGRMNLFFKIKEYYGIDTTPRMIHNAIILNRNKTNAQFRLCDGKTLEFPDNFFDIVIASTVLLHLKVKTVEWYAKEIFRVLKPNGYFLTNLSKKSNINIQQVFHKFRAEQLKDWFNDDVFKFHKEVTE